MNAHALLEALPHGILRTDAAGRIVYTNGAARRLLGVPPQDGDELAGRACDSDRGELRAMWARCLFERRPTRGDLRFVPLGARMETQPRWMTLELTPVDDDLPHSGGVLAVVRDATQARAELDALCAARDAAQRQCAMAYANAAVSRAVAEEASAATQARSEFITCLSDELRTPLAAMVGLADTALACAHDGRQREALASLRLGAERVLDIVDDVLDLSSMEAGLLTLNHVPFQLKECVTSAAERGLARSDSSGREVSCSFDGAVPPAVLGDPGRLRQVVSSLVRALASCTEQGPLSLTVSPVDTGGHAESARWTSIDAPFTAAPLLLAFELRAPTARNSDAGVGASSPPAGSLNARLCRGLLELMSGGALLQHADATSTVWRFGVRLAAAMVSANDTPPASLDLADVRVLVLSAAPASVSAALEALGASAHVAADLNSAHAALAAEAFSAIVVDERPFAADGFDLAAALRGACNTPVLLLASSGRRGDGARCRDVGVAAYLPKPFACDELAHALCGLVDTARSPSAHAPPITRHSLRERGVALPAPSMPSALDRDALLERLGGDEDLAKEMARLMLGQLDTLVAAVDEAARALDAKRLFRASHGLKGAAANLSAEPMAKAAEKLESMGRAGSLEALPEACAVLHGELARLRPALQSLAA